MSLFVQVKIEWHFPFIGPFRYFFADAYLVHLQKYWHHLQQKTLTYHLQRVLLLIICYLTKSGPRMEPCVTPALKGNHSDAWPFDRTLSNLLLKKLSMKLKRESETPINLYLDINPLSYFVKSLRHFKKHTTSFKSGINIKSFDSAYFFIKNHNVKTSLRERIV